MTIFVVFADRFLTIAACSDVMERAGEFKA